MKKGILLLVLATSVFAENKAEFCAQRADKDFVRMDMMNNPDTAMSFRNRGGLANGGVCWWHSRFHRNMAHLALFKPNKEMPTNEEAKKIIKKIRKGKSVVVIPGLRDIHEFSYVYRGLIQKELEAWQRTDGFINQQWIVGLAGGSSRSENGLRKSMDKLYNYVVKEGNVAYQKLQIKGITAHAWLVVDMKKSSAGYALKVIDSNFPGDIQTAYYDFGDTSINANSFGYGAGSFYGDFAPYTGRKGELKKVKKAIKKFCK